MTPSGFSTSPTRTEPEVELAAGCPTRPRCCCQLSSLKAQPGLLFIYCKCRCHYTGVLMTPEQQGSAPATK